MTESTNKMLLCCHEMNVTMATCTDGCIALKDPGGTTMLMGNKQVGTTRGRNMSVMHNMQKQRTRDKNIK